MKKAWSNTYTYSVFFTDLQVFFSKVTTVWAGLHKKIFVDNHRPENILVTTPTASKHRKELEAVACTREYDTIRDAILTCARKPT